MNYYLVEIKGIFQKSINNPLNRAFIHDSNTNKDILSKFSEFLSKQITRWKRLKNEEMGGPGILCRICEQTIPANKMIVNTRYKYILETYRIMLAKK